MSDRAASGVSGRGGGGGSAASRALPSVAQFYDWSSNITGCVQVRQYHQLDQRHQFYEQQQEQQQQVHQQHTSHLEAAATASSSQVFPVRRPSKATLAKMRQYYNPSMKLLQAGRPADAAWREASQLTKGERHLAMARGAAAAYRQTQALSLFDDQEQQLRASPPPHAGPRTAAVDSLCQCTYDPRLYPVYTSRSQGPMCVVCKLRRPQLNGTRQHQRDWAEAEAASAEALAEAAGEEGRLRAPPSTPRPVEGRTEVIGMREGGRKATLDVFLPNAEREPASPLPRPSCDSARSQRTLSSPEPPSA